MHSSTSDVKYLLSNSGRFLYEIQLNSSVNKMSVDNLATVIGVNLIRPKIEDPAIIMRGKRNSWNHWHRNTWHAEILGCIHSLEINDFLWWSCGYKPEMCLGTASTAGQSQAVCLLGCKGVYGDKTPSGITLCVPFMEFSPFRNLVRSSLCCLEQGGVKSFFREQRKLKEMRVLIYFYSLHLLHLAL